MVHFLLLLILALLPLCLDPASAEIVPLTKWLHHCNVSRLARTMKVKAVKWLFDCQTRMALRLVQAQGLCSNLQNCFADKHAHTKNTLTVYTCSSINQSINQYSFIAIMVKPVRSKTRTDCHAEQHCTLYTLYNCFWSISEKDYTHSDDMKDKQIKWIAINRLSSRRCLVIVVIVYRYRSIAWHHHSIIPVPPAN